MKLTLVCLWSNGLTIVFDDKHQQVPELQGPIEEKWELIMAAADPETEFSPNWPRCAEQATRSYAQEYGVRYRG